LEFSLLIIVGKGEERRENETQRGRRKVPAPPNISRLVEERCRKEKTSSVALHAKSGPQDRGSCSQAIPYGVRKQFNLLRGLNDLYLEKEKPGILRKGVETCAAEGKPRAGGKRTLTIRGAILRLRNKGASFPDGGTTLP